MRGLKGFVRDLSKLGVIIHITFFMSPNNKHEIELILYKLFPFKIKVCL